MEVMQEDSKSHAKRPIKSMQYKSLTLMYATGSGWSY